MRNPRQVHHRCAQTPFIQLRKQFCMHACKKKKKLLVSRWVSVATVATERVQKNILFIRSVNSLSSGIEGLWGVIQTHEDISQNTARETDISSVAFHASSGDVG